ncbi:hypothetical protein A3K55_01355 [Candidatus Shapirobacteria bacterium RBG_13_44_7]|uniref:Nudix hydrolase domain-containing protein n=1 Tax=Candidatus Shapirobacteria bacterium RBG_13_44_7 TaxID=1802149 RepID=A0A1F7SHW7_9BACT|nr:MAG: hypothetical protein A3K55_01355 [Candidatus Shapirobacteria bacterium RBG_13_44_7]
MVIIKGDKLLAQYTDKSKFYYYIGGHLDYGETIADACTREIKEECGQDAQLEFKKILYIRDFIWPEKEEHSVELFVLGDINKFEDLEGRLDPQHPNNDVWCTWLDINNLPDNLYPHPLSQKLLADYKSGFPKEGEYVGRMNK